MPCRFHRVDVGAQKEELPAILLFLPPDHLAHLTGGIAVAGIFHAVGGDDKKGVLRHILRPGIFVDVSDVVDGSAHCIQQRGAAPHIVFPVSDGFHPVRPYPVMEYLDPVVEQYGGDQRLAGPLLLLFQLGIEAADGIGLQPLHGTAAVQNEHQFGQILFHKQIPHTMLFWLQAQYRGILYFRGRLMGDKFILCL